MSAAPIGPRWGTSPERWTLALAPRRLLAEAFPNLRGVQGQYRASVGPIQVRGGAANAGTLGGAFDVWMQLQATQRLALQAAFQGAALVGADQLGALRKLADRLGTLEVPSGEAVPGPWTGPSAALNERDLLRLCWAAACLTEVYRVGRVPSGSPLAGLPASDPVSLLALAPSAALEELSELASVARESLLPHLQTLSMRGPTSLAPTFAGSRRMAADADVVTGHTLVEIKTVLGSPTATGRRATLPVLTLYQLLGYVLHDYDDRYALTSVALYQARYGHMAKWPLDQLLHELAGAPVDLPELRRRWAVMLETGEVPPRETSNGVSPC